MGHNRPLGDRRGIPWNRVPRQSPERSEVGRQSPAGSKVMLQPRRLRLRVLGLLTTLLLVTLIGIGISVYYMARRNEQQLWQGRQHEGANYAARTVSDFVQRLQTPLALAGSIDRQSFSAPGVAQAFIQQEPALLEIVRLGNDGEVIASAAQDQSLLANLFTIPQSHWFTQAAEDRLYVGDVQLSANQQPYLIISIRAPGGDVVAARVSLYVLEEVVRGAGLGDTGQTYIIGPQGNILAHSDSAIVPSGSNLRGRPEMTALTTTGEWLEQYSNLQGTDVMGVAVPVRGTELYVISELAVSEARASSRSVLQVFGSGLLLSGIALIVLVTGFLERVVLRPLEALRTGADKIAQGELGHRIAVRWGDEIGQVAITFNRMAGELEGLYDSLERQVAERTHDLERRSAYLQTGAEVGRIASSILEVDRLMWQTVTLIWERFGLYHVGLFRVDETGQWAVYSAGAGAADRQLLEDGFRLEVGGASAVGWCMTHAQMRYVEDSAQEAGYVRHPLLPDTRSEAALPLTTRGRVTGALSVQSERPQAFGPDVVVALGTIADQLAVALDNARLFAERQEALQAARRAYRETSERAWAELLQSRQGWGYRYVFHELLPLEGKVPGDAGPIAGELMEARRSGQVVESTERPLLALPLRVRGQVVGVLGFEKKGRAWRDDERRMLENLADQVGAALESARLFEESQRRAARERLTAQMTARMRETLDIETVLKTAIREMGSVLGLPRVEVRMLEGVADGNGLGVPGGRLGPPEGGDGPVPRDAGPNTKGGQDAVQA